MYMQIAQFSYPCDYTNLLLSFIMAIVCNYKNKALLSYLSFTPVASLMKTCVVVNVNVELKLSLYYIVVTVSFSQAEYDATNGTADIVLVLSQPLDTQPLTVHGSFVSDAEAIENSLKGKMLIANVS